MIPFFGSRRLAANREVIERLNEAVVLAARAPVFYAAGGVADTFNGRFELLVLHCALVVRRLRVLGEPGPSIAQALIDTVFRNLDPALRELGVGDMGVPKRMKRLAEGFLGRSVAYDEALTSGDADRLAAALARNVFTDARSGWPLAAYVVATAAMLDTWPIEAVSRGELHFPDPAALVGAFDVA